MNTSRVVLKVNSNNPSSLPTHLHNKCDPAAQPVYSHSCFTFQDLITNLLHQWKINASNLAKSWFLKEGNHKYF